jgi:hypothetical protein
MVSDNSTRFEIAPTVDPDRQNVRAFIIKLANVRSVYRGMCSDDVIVWECIESRRPHNDTLSFQHFDAHKLKQAVITLTESYSVVTCCSM